MELFLELFWSCSGVVVGYSLKLSFSKEDALNSSSVFTRFCPSAFWSQSGRFRRGFGMELFLELSFSKEDALNSSFVFTHFCQMV